MTTQPYVMVTNLLKARLEVGSPSWQRAKDLSELCTQHGYCLTRWQIASKNKAGEWSVVYHWIIYVGKSRPRRRNAPGFKKFLEFTVLSEGNQKFTALYKNLGVMYSQFVEAVVYDKNLG